MEANLNTRFLIIVANLYVSGSHHSHQRPRSPDLNHQITNHSHLLQLIKLPFICSHSTLLPRPVYRPHLNKARLSALILTVLAYLRHSCHSMVAFLISLLSGKALLRARAIRNAQSTIINSYKAFSNHFKEVFGSSRWGMDGLSIELPL
uniref:Uncharacterized protein n=1 Tax=Sinocyclocheilus rhinocerous TaxID=307959 RepID=A0A673FRT7_9TELE